jgi:hypothetical protein
MKIKSLFLTLYRALEKMVSFRAHNPEIVGSSPTCATKNTGVAGFISTNSNRAGFNEPRCLLRIVGKKPGARTGLKFSGAGGLHVISKEGQRIRGLFLLPYFQRLITFLIFLSLLYILMSCKGSAYHLRKAERLDARKKAQIDKAIRKGAKIKQDTTFKTVTFKVPGVKVEFTPKVISTKSEPLIFIKDSVITKVVFREGINGRDTVFVGTDCPDQEVKEKIPVAVNTDIEAKQNWTTLEIIGLSLLIAVIAFLVGYFFKVIKKLFTLL